MEGWGVWWYGLGLRLLPRGLRRRAGADMREAFLEGQRAARLEAGRPGVARFWLREGSGLMRTAVRARLPDAWTRRTAPDRPAPPPAPGALVDNLLSDLRFSLRTFVRRPGLLLLAVTTLSLGIGSSTAMFSVIDSVLISPLDYPEPDEVHAVYPTWPELVDHPTMGGLAERGTWSWPELWLVAEQQEAFSWFAGYAPTQVTLTPAGGRPERVPAGVAGWELFPLLGADTRVGRLFDATDLRADNVVLLDHAAWRDRWGADPDIVGSAIQISGSSYQVVGVLAEGFNVARVDAELWLLRTGSSTDAGVGNHGSTRALGRLAPGVSRERARDEVARILEALPRGGHPDVHGSTVEPFHAELTREVRPVLLVMLAASGLLLLVACGNVAAILLGAGIDRERELAVRGAVGATRGRLTRQLLTESTILAGAGGAGGVLVAFGTTRALTFLAPPGVPRLTEVAVDGWVLAFAVAVAVGGGLLFGLIPAFSLSSTDLAGAIGSTRTTGSKRQRLQNAVVIGELAMATVLLFGGVLLTRTVSALNRVDPGFDYENLLEMSMALSSRAFDSGDDEADAEAFRAWALQIREEIAALPGVTGVASSSVPPFFNFRGNNPLVPVDWPEDAEFVFTERRLVSEGYLELLGIPLLEGRSLEAADHDPGAEHVVVVSRGFAELAWPGQSAVGRLVEHLGVEARVVGVAENIRDEQLEGETELAYYAPQWAFGGPGFPLVIRTSTDPEALIPAVRERVWSYDPDIPITRIAATTELIGDRLTEQVYRARLMGVFAALAGVFALLGVYGVTSRSVARRTREMALRVALGADRGRVRGIVAREAVGLALVGVVGGIVVAVAAGGLIERFLWGVTRTDVVTILAVGVGLPLMAALAAMPPARRATRVDPLEALKAE